MATKAKKARRVGATIEVDGTVSGDAALIKLLDETVRHIKANKGIAAAKSNASKAVVFERLRGNQSLTLTHRS